MSCVEIYGIHPDGEVRRFSEARCAPACATHIWHQLARKYGVKDPMAYPHQDPEPLWGLPKTGRMEENDRIVLLFTYDGVWIARENILTVSRALNLFWRDHPQRWSEFENKFFDVVGTIPEVARQLAEAVHNPKFTNLRGVCFNQTSVNSNPWHLYPQRAEDEDDEGRPFNFNIDKVDYNKTEPFELLGGQWSPTTSPGDQHAEV